MFSIITDKEYSVAVSFFTGKKAIEREERYTLFLYNSLQRYQKDTNVTFINNILQSAKVGGKIRSVKKLIDAIKLHGFDKETGLFLGEGKISADKLAFLRSNWEAIFQSWMNEETKVKEEVEFSEGKAMEAVNRIIKKMEELGLNKADASKLIVERLQANIL